MSDTTKIDDGGPAFPGYTMEEKEDTVVLTKLSPGMALRDWFAGQALVGIIARNGIVDHKTCDDVDGMDESFREVPDGDAIRSGEAEALVAYETADAMLAARKAVTK